MARLEFETLMFKEKENEIVVTLLKQFRGSISTKDLARVGSFVIERNAIEFSDVDEQKAWFRFSGILEKAFERLENSLTGNSVTYVHRNSGIPLIGNVAFGIVYRESSIIEIKPVTSCNLDCVYCSISEGLSSKKHDFVVEKEYLLEELQGLLEEVGESVEIHIGVQGEPFLYADMPGLIEDLQSWEKVHTISIDTNGTLLSEKLLDRLSSCDKLQINMSLDAIDEDVAKRVAGVKNYNLAHVKKMIAYACSVGLKVIVAPVMTRGYNIEEMEKIIKWVGSLKVKPILGIQNFLRYKTGRNPGKEISWDEFYAMLSTWEKEYEIKLKLSKDDFNIRKVKALPKPFVKGEIVRCEMVCPDRFSNSVICAAQNRSISVPGVKFSKGKKIKVKIMRDKHNVYTGKLIG